MNDSVKHIKMHTKCIGLIISPNETFLVSTSIKVKGIESEKHTSLCSLSILCRSHVIDDTRIYTYFIGTCIFYSVILGKPLLCSQYVEMVFVCVDENEENLNVFWQNHFSVTVKSWIIALKSASTKVSLSAHAWVAVMAFKSSSFSIKYLFILTNTEEWIIYLWKLFHVISVDIIGKKMSIIQYTITALVVWNEMASPKSTYSQPDIKLEAVADCTGAERSQMCLCSKHDCMWSFPVLCLHGVAVGGVIISCQRNANVCVHKRHNIQTQLKAQVSVSQFLC